MCCTATSMLPRTSLVGSSCGSCGRKPMLMPGCGTRLAFEFLVEAGHDPQQRRFAGTVQAEHADLGAGEEAQGDVAKDDPLRGYDLPDSIHRVNELCHGRKLRSRFGRAKKIGNYRSSGPLDATAAGSGLLGCPTLSQGPAPVVAVRPAIDPGADGLRRRAEPLRLRRGPPVRSRPARSIPARNAPQPRLRVAAAAGSAASPSVTSWKASIIPTMSTS